MCPETLRNPMAEPEIKRDNTEKIKEAVEGMSQKEGKKVRLERARLARDAKKLERKDEARKKDAELKRAAEERKARQAVAQVAEPKGPFAELYPTEESDRSTPPADTKLAALAARTDATPKPTGMWGKFKSFFTTSRDERASAKFSTMQADSDETSADRRAAVKGQAMMDKQDKGWFKEEMKKANEEIEDERILAKEGPKWSAEAGRMMKEPPESPEIEAARFQSSAYNARKTAGENAQTEHDSVKIDAKITDPKVLERISKRAEREKANSDKLVAGYENKYVDRDQDLEDWTMEEGSSARPGGEDSLTRIAVGGGFKRGVDKAIDNIGDKLDERAGKKFVKSADELDEFKVEMRAAKQSLKEQEDVKKGQRMLDKAEGKVMSPKEFSNLMKAGKLRARAEELEREVEETVEPGSGEKAGVEFKNTVGERLNQIEQEMTQLKPTIESTRLGGRLFGFKLKIDKDGYVKNLPGHNEELAIQDLMKEKERLGKKGDTEGANKIVDQIEALERYPNLLVERDKLLAGSGSKIGPRSMVVGGVWPGGTPRTR